MFNIVYSKNVKNDLKTISEYISLDNPLYSIKTINSILEIINILEEFPYIGKEIDGNIREIVERKYKYRVIYEIIKMKIVILAVYKYKNNW